MSIPFVSHKTIAAAVLEGAGLHRPSEASSVTFTAVNGKAISVVTDGSAIEAYYNGLKYDGLAPVLHYNSDSGSYLTINGRDLGQPELVKIHESDFLHLVEFFGRIKKAKR
jgi:hypothetical protein